MCGRYGLTVHREQLDGAYPVDVVLSEHRPRWNIAPTQEAPVLWNDGQLRRIENFQWGLVPHWAKDPSIGGRMINARSETVAAKPAFRDAWRQRRRCLVLADGFYEWRKPESGKGPKTPFWIRLNDGRPFALAGLWELWAPPPRTEPAMTRLRTFTILTTEPNALVRGIHDRMPVILPRAEWDRWVDPGVPSEALAETLVPFPAAAMDAHAVSTYVNDPRHEGAACAAPAGTTDDAPRRPAG
jgi:putative SOS response-associated peptidase YedK